MRRLNNVYSLLPARADEDGFYRSLPSAVSARRRLTEFNPISADDLAALEFFLVGLGDLPADSSFHEALGVAGLAIIEDI